VVLQLLNFFLGPALENQNMCVGHWLAILSVDDVNFDGAVARDRTECVNQQWQ
jgi:hypothetical protein